MPPEVRNQALAEHAAALDRLGLTHPPIWLQDLQLGLGYWSGFVFGIYLQITTAILFYGWHGFHWLFIKE